MLTTEAKAVRTGPKEIFLYLLSFIMVYLSAVHVGILLYQYINIAFPDPLVDYSRDPSQYLGPLRWAIATLVVVFPVFVWTRWYLAKEIKRLPEKLKLQSRKWLLYFTLFAAGLVIIGDLVAILNRFLEGELTARFGLKVLTIFAIAGATFIYYFWDLQQPKVSEIRVRWFSRTAIAAVVIAILSGFVVAGSPKSQRLRRFDERRVNDLQGLQYQILSYWQDKATLPQDLNQLKDAFSGYEAPLDPQKGQPYEYRIKEGLKFELCAEFNEPSLALQNMPESMKSSDPWENPSQWQHKAGHTCFERTIDPDRYQKDDPAAIKAQPAPVR